MKIKVSWLVQVRALWVAGFSLFFLLNLDQFSFAAGFGPAPKYWITGFFLVTTASFLPSLKRASWLRKPIMWWVVAYLLMSVLWMGWADNQEAAREGVVLVITTVLFVGMAVIAYPNIDVDSWSWRGMLWLALSLAVASILLEFFVPTAYVFANAGQGITGRAAGLYLNPNAAGQALLLILACLMQRRAPKLNLIAACIALVGLFLTFSRGGLVGWMILVALATVIGRLPRWFLLVLVACGAIILFAGAQILDALSVLLPRFDSNSLGRLAWLLGQGQLNDYSAGEREYLAGFAWQQFWQAPFLGHGLGYIWAWSAGLGTHNMILRHLVEYGLLGALILPTFLILSIRSSPRDESLRWLLVTAILVMVLSMFTHNMLESGTFVLPWLALALVRPALARSNDDAVKSRTRGGRHAEV